MQELHYRELGEGSPLIILHGLFGASDNWLTLGRRFAENHKVYLIDQRNHGQSFGLFVHFHLAVIFGILGTMGLGSATPRRRSARALK